MYCVFYNNKQRNTMHHREGSDGTGQSISADTIITPAVVIFPGGKFIHQLFV